MLKKAVVLVLAATLFTAGGGLRAAPPVQFRAWGSQGPNEPALETGWTEVREPVRLFPESALTAEERQRGFLIAAPDPLSVVGPEAVPLACERATALDLFGPRGEYETASFVLHAIAPLEDVRIDVGNLRAAQGQVIPADCVDVRFVRSVRVPVDHKAKTFRREPFLLEKRKTVSAAKGTALRVWLTVKIPDDAAAGDYTGTVAVQVAGQASARIKLVAKVLPLLLPPAPVEMAMFFPSPADSDELLMKQLIDAREHGCNGIEPALSVVIKTRDRDFGEDDVAATRAQCKRLMAAEKKVFGPREFPVTFELGHEIAYFWDRQKAWFSFWPHSKKIDHDFLHAVDVVCELAKEEGWPPLRAYALDEAGAHNLLDEAVYYYGLIKKHRPDLATWTDIGGGIAMGIDEIGPLSASIDVFNTNRFTPEIAKTLVGRKKPYAVYNGCGPTPAGARFFFGFYGYKTGASQIAQWAYYSGNALFQGNGFRQDDEGYVYLAADGPLPSVMWEAVREGIKDYRYLSLLARSIAAAGASDRPGAREAAAEADRVLRGLLGRIGWGFQPLDTGNRTPPPHPSMLRKWRRQVAAQILKLQPLLAHGGGARPSAARRAPLELPWAEPAGEQARYGPELLPPSGFEETMKPWRVETWNGKGEGQMDDTQSHTGRKSVRIDVPAASGSQAVTVLVWPTWGDGKLNLSLDEGRRYEFSGWIKLARRSVPPRFCISLPDGAEKSTQTGQEGPTPSGWYRVWARSELKFPAALKYLGVWVQGPGTVWIDDLSLREVVPAPLELSLDQDIYDGMDRAGILGVKINRRPPPAQVRFLLSRVGGQAVSQLAAPFDAETSLAAAPEDGGGGPMLLGRVALGQCRFAFNPSTLAPGKYELKVELLDPRGEVVAARSSVVERVAD
ncbi:MAG: glycoside hydrolase domain-containing protein [Thermoguttaceae bacterium]|jgi:hypothetical protein